MQAERPRAQRRTALCVQQCSVALQLHPHPLPAELYAAILKSLVKHILYARGQLPCLYADGLASALELAEALRQRSEQSVASRRPERRRLKKEEKRAIKVRWRAHRLRRRRCALCN